MLYLPSNLKKRHHDYVDDATDNVFPLRKQKEQ